MQALSEHVTYLDKEIAALSSQQTAYHHLLTIPGVGRLPLQHLSVKWIQYSSPPAENYPHDAA